MHELFDITNPEFWVRAGLLVFFGLLVALKVLPRGLTKALDSHADHIRAELDEAVRLRQEAQALLDDVKAQREETERQAAEMLAAAKDDAKRLAKEAKAKLDEQIARRADVAERKIANAEAQALAEVKAAAADLAAETAQSVLTARLAAGGADPMIDTAIKQLAGAKLN